MNLHRLLQHGDLLLDSSILGLQPLDQSQVSIEVKWTNERTALPDLDHHQISEREVEVLLAVVGLAPPVARLGDPLGRVVQLLLRQRNIIFRGPYIQGHSPLSVMIFGPFRIESFNSVFNVKALDSRLFRPQEKVGLFRDCEIFAKVSLKL